MAVGMVTRWPRNIIPRTPMKPWCPTAYPNLRKSIAPRMVEIVVKNTGMVPNPCFPAVNFFAMASILVTC